MTHLRHALVPRFVPGATEHAAGLARFGSVLHIIGSEATIVGRLGLVLLQGEH